jgi:hypothetical protein
MRTATIDEPFPVTPCGRGHAPRTAWRGGHSKNTITSSRSPGSVLGVTLRQRRRQGFRWPNGSEPPPPVCTVVIRSETRGYADGSSDRPGQQLHESLSNQGTVPRHSTHRHRPGARSTETGCKSNPRRFAKRNRDGCKSNPRRLSKRNWDTPQNEPETQRRTRDILQIEPEIRRKTNLGHIAKRTRDPPQNEPGTQRRTRDKLQIEPETICKSNPRRSGN